MQNNITDPSQERIYENLPVHVCVYKKSQRYADLSAEATENWDGMKHFGPRKEKERWLTSQI